MPNSLFAKENQSIFLSCLNVFEDFFVSYNVLLISFVLHDFR